MIAAYRQTHSPSQLVWSEGWQTFDIHQINRINCHNDVIMTVIIITLEFCHGTLPLPTSNKQPSDR